MKLIFILLTFSFSAVAQSGNYIITLKGDTVSAEIKRPIDEVTSYDNVVVKDKNNRKINYTPDELLGYKLGQDVFKTVDIGMKKKENKFLKIIEQGKCTLYQYQLELDVTVIANIFYGQRNNEPLHELKFVELRDGTDLYFLDDKQLTFDLRQGKYSRLDFQKIVKRYNQGAME